MQTNDRAIPAKVLVELYAPTLDYRNDALLPSHMTVANLRIGLLRLLREKERRFFKATNIMIFHNGKQLKDNDTLASLGIWDGSILELEITIKQNLHQFDPF